MYCYVINDELVRKLSIIGYIRGIETIRDVLDALIQEAYSDLWDCVEVTFDVVGD